MSSLEELREMVAEAISRAPFGVRTPPGEPLHPSSPVEVSGTYRTPSPPPGKPAIQQTETVPGRQRAHYRRPETTLHKGKSSELTHKWRQRRRSNPMASATMEKGENVPKDSMHKGWASSDQAMSQEGTGMPEDDAKVENQYHLLDRSGPELMIRDDCDIEEIYPDRQRDLEWEQWLDTAGGLDEELMPIQTPPPPPPPSSSSPQ